MWMDIIEIPMEDQKKERKKTVLVVFRKEGDQMEDFEDVNSNEYKAVGSATDQCIYFWKTEWILQFPCELITLIWPSHLV